MGRRMRVPFRSLCRVVFVLSLDRDIGVLERNEMNGTCMRACMQTGRIPYYLEAWNNCVPQTVPTAGDRPESVFVNPNIVPHNNIPLTVSSEIDR